MKALTRLAGGTFNMCHPPRGVFLSLLIFGPLISILPPAGAATVSTNNLDNPVILEIKVYGRGMMRPNRATLTFFRLHEDGLLEYDARTMKKYEKKKIKLAAEDVRKLIQLADQPDFYKANERYPALENLGDAVLIVTLTYSHGAATKRITITNYMPDHPRAEDFYPVSLRKLLQAAEDLRPATGYERKHGLGKIGLPFN